MVSKLGTSIGQYFYKMGYIEEYQIDAIRYYTEVIFNEYLQIIITIIIGIILNKAIVTLIYLLCFIALRRYSGGYHAKSILMCNIISYGLYFGSIYLYQNLNIWIGIILWTVSFVYLIKHGKSIIGDRINNKKYHDRMLRVALVFFSIVFMLFYSYFVLWSLIVFQVMLLNVINERSKYENCR